MSSFEHGLNNFGLSQYGFCFFTTVDPMTWKNLRFCLMLFCIIAIQIATGSILSAQENRSFQGLPMINNYLPENYKAGIQNWDIIQDRSGYIYVANNMGLLQFDGKSWERFGASDTKVRSIIQASDGKIYLGSQADFGYFDTDLSGKLSYVSLADSLPVSLQDFDETWKVFEIEGKIYFCTFKGIYIYSNGKLTVVPTESRLDISFQVENQLYTFDTKKGLLVLKNGKLELVRNGEFFVDKRISNILNFDKKRLLITTFDEGAFLYDGDVESFEFRGAFWKNNYQINYSTRLRNGSIALATQNAGLFIISTQGDLILHLDKASGLPDLTINYIFEDNLDGLWLALNNGLSRVDLNSPFTFIDDRIGIQGAGYTSLKVNGNLYLGTNIGLYLLEGDRLEFLPGSEGQVYSIQQINGHVLMGHDAGTFSIKGKKVTQISSQKGTWVFKPIPGSQNLILQGNYDGLSLLESNENEVRYLRKIKGFEESSRLIEFGDQSLWVSHGYKGVFKITLDSGLTQVVSSKLYNSENGFPKDILINVFNISNRLIFTADSGFFEYDLQKDQFVPSTVYQSAFETSPTIIDLESDVLNNIYFIERNMLGVLKSDPLEGQKLFYSSFNKIKSLWNDDLANVIVIDDKNILFGGKNGFIHYAPDSDIPRVIQSKIWFKSISNHGVVDSILYRGHDFDGNVMEKINGISFPYQQNSMTFEFVSPHFESGAEIYYQYLLEGFDEDWSDWTYENRKEYTNLREGDYLFRIRAKNIFDEVSSETIYSFTVKPPFYRSIFAYLFYAFGSLISLFLAYKFLDRRYNRKTIKLEEEQSQALRKKEREIQTITQRTEEEIVKLKNEKLQSEIEYKNQELTSSAMNLIQKNQLLATIKSTLNSISNEEQNKGLNKQLGRLVKSIDRDLENGSEWEQFSENFDQVHGNFITRLKEVYPTLTPQEIKFSAYIRMNLNTKEIANLLGISVRGVEIGRYRVRKKLGLARKDNLSDFLLRF
ncbi:triple tyrosine motif-containing protein [Algoriphagus sp.]|uniref:triple tyrosine motif-containing protein n=1 Tax=Algoriphagus sp. TaxID=1872435 RepID=UPI0025F26627|nr:triple tyrosine motif-containing protein [Algoriphagus sp.]